MSSAELRADALLADRLRTQRGRQAAGIEHADQEVHFLLGELPVIMPRSWIVLLICGAESIVLSRMMPSWR